MAAYIPRAAGLARTLTDARTSSLAYGDEMSIKMSWRPRIEDHPPGWDRGFDSVVNDKFPDEGPTERPTTAKSCFLVDSEGNRYPFKSISEAADWLHVDGSYLRIRRRRGDPYKGYMLEVVGETC